MPKKSSSKSPRARTAKKSKPASKSRRHSHPTCAPASPRRRESYEIAFHAKDVPVFRLKINDWDFYGAARYWSYIVSNRRRITDDTRQGLMERSTADLQKMGVDQETLRRFAEAGVVEVRIPYKREDLGWAARIFPWEGVIAHATKALRGDRGITVVRMIERIAPSPVTAVDHPSQLMFAQSAPGRLAGYYSFASECRLVHSALGLTDAGPQACQSMLTDPSLEQLAEAIATRRPHVIHLTGVDVHQGEMLIGLDNPEQADGFLLRGGANSAAIIKPLELAHALRPPEHQVLLVAFNCWNAAARLAALAVAEGGARLAIGFQDLIDDTVAEQFYADFYSTWRSSRWNVLAAFQHARQRLVSHPLGRQAGIVLWSDHSLLAKPKAVPRVPTAGRIASDDTDLAKQDPREVLEVQVKPEPQLNYSLLHNNRDLFETFILQKLKPGRLRGIRIAVELYAGDVTFPYRLTRNLEADTWRLDLRSVVRVPLVSALLRQSRESIRTTIFVEVTCGGVDVYRDTHQVTLPPVDEWRDTDQDRCWLPSFVMPEDKGIARIIAGAQRYLTVLADDRGAGFDGYQSVGADPTDPLGVVDLQARALWTALIYDCPLSYINPPPTYTDLSQRIRTPDRILTEQRGTCIDLALLYAACLEYVGIYPVIFLIRGHAFPGYWRSPDKHDMFERFGYAQAVEGTQQAAHKDWTNEGQDEAWMVGGSAGYAELVPALQSGDLVPLEATLLTQQAAFDEAGGAGLNNLQDQTLFDAMVDVQTARNHGVTPLPIYDRND